MQKNWKQSIDAYLSVYQALYGFKDILLSRDEECGNMFTPWQTGYFQFPTRIEAIPNMFIWAASEELPFYVPDITSEEQELVDKLLAEHAKYMEEREG
jgi:hypothetical protein